MKRPRRVVPSPLTAGNGMDSRRTILGSIDVQSTVTEVDRIPTQLRGGVDRGADDANLTEDELGLGGARRGFDAGHRDRGTARLRQRHGGPLESLAFPARLVAGRHDLRTRRNDLCDGGE